MVGRESPWRLPQGGGGDTHLLMSRLLLLILDLVIAMAHSFPEVSYPAQEQLKEVL